MAGINFHPAPGLGDLLPGFFVVPQNPVTSQGVGVTYVQGIGDILPGSFPVPMNPIVNYTTGNVRPIGTGVSGCGCGGSCGGCGGSGKLNGQPTNGGMSGISEDWAKIQADIMGGNIGNVITDTVFGVPVWAIGAGLALFLFAGGEKHSYAGRGRRAARAAAQAF